MTRTTLEICIDSVAGCDAAIAGGADRIELCGALSVGGLTPSPGLATLVVARARAAGVRVHAMVRPRAGDFTYDAGEVATAIAQVKGVTLAEDVTGPYDVIVRAEARNVDELGKLVVAKVQTLEGITRTLTCPVVHI